MVDRTIETGDPRRHDQAVDESPSAAESGRENVVSLQDVARDIRFPVLDTLEAYWQRLRGTRLVPARAEVDPRQIEDVLEYAFILERIAPGMARFRLAGMHMNDLMGMEVRGMPLTAFFAPDARKEVSSAVERVFDDPAIARLGLSGETGIGRPGLDGRLLLLPLKSDFGDVSRALGCLVTVGPVGRSPRRFSLTSQSIAPIAGPQHDGDRRIKGWSSGTSKTRGAASPQSPRRPQDGPAAAMGGDAARQTPPGAPPPGAAAPPRGRPKLYIVKSDD